MDPFLGQVIMFGGNFAPRGWAFCEGQLLSIDQNQALFSILGTTYGGDGRTSFGLPDLRGRVNIGPGSGPGLTPYQIGAKGGAATTTLTTNNLPAHNHALTTSDGVADQATGAGGFFPSNPTRGGTNLYASAAGTPQTMGATTANQGGGNPINNMQPYTCVSFIIALQGTYPARN